MTAMKEDGLIRDSAIPLLGIYKNFLTCAHGGPYKSIGET